MALTQYKQGQTYFGYDPQTSQGIAFSDPTQFGKYFGSFDQNAAAPSFDTSKLMATPNQLISLNPGPSAAATTAPAVPTTATTATPAIPDISGLEKQYEINLAPTADENQTQTELDNLIASRDMGINKVKSEPIPMDIIRGYSQNILDNANTQQQTLQQRLATLQAKRQASLEASKFALSRADQQAQQIKDDAQKKADQETQIQQNYVSDVRQENKINTPFYKYVGSSQVYDSKTGEPVSYDEYKKRGGAGVPGTAFPDVQEISNTPQGTATKFETVTLGSGKAARKVRYGYDAKGNIVSAVDLATGQSVLGNSGASAPISNLGGNSAKASTTKKITVQDDVSSMSGALKSAAGSDGYISPEDWKKALAAWQAAGRSAASFKTNFGNFINPADPQDYK